MLTVEQALQVIVREVLPIAPRPGRLDLGGVLAQPIHADHDAPPFDRSQVDGFALRSADAVVGASLRLAGQVDAGGQLHAAAVTPGTCVGINTGGVIPPGADGVLMVEMAERVTRGGQEFVVVKQAVQSGQGIQKRASDTRSGEVILTAGLRLGPAQLALCAAAGVTQPVVRRVRVAVLSTGDELVAPETPLPLPAGKIRNSNQVMLCALAREAGGVGADVVDLGTVGDEAQRMRALLERALTEADLLVVCGGMSMGTRDLVPGLLKEMGVTMHVEKVRIKPGKPFVLGTRSSGEGRKYVAGLPGNPVSSFVTFQRFVRPMLRQMEGATDAARIFRARVDRALPANGDREFYQPCVLESAATGMQARALAWRGSADMFTLSKANGLIIRAEREAAIAAGGEVDVLTW